MEVRRDRLFFVGVRNDVLQDAHVDAIPKPITFLPARVTLEHLLDHSLPNLGCINDLSTRKRQQNVRKLLLDAAKERAFRRDNNKAIPTVVCIDVDRAPHLIL